LVDGKVEVLGTTRGKTFKASSQKGESSFTGKGKVEAGRIPKKRGRKGWESREKPSGTRE